MTLYEDYMILFQCKRECGKRQQSACVKRISKNVLFLQKT